MRLPPLDPKPQTPNPEREGLLFILSGPSGVGKDALIKRLKADGFPMHYAVTATTRPLHSGRTMMVLETELARDDGNLAAKVTQTQVFHYG